MPWIKYRYELINTDMVARAVRHGDDGTKLSVPGGEITLPNLSIEEFTRIVRDNPPFVDVDAEWLASRT